MIGKKLKHLIKVMKRKQIDLAKHLGISPSRLSNYLSDKREPDFEMLGEMAKFLGVDLNYFSEIDFSNEKKSEGSVTEEYSMIAEADALYSPEKKDSVIRVPLTPINAKKRGINTVGMPLSSLFFTGIEEPEKNVIVFEVNGYIPASVASENDFLVCAKASAVKVADGDFVFENGRNAKFFKYYKHDGKIMLINEDNKKEHITLAGKKDLEGYFKILWVIAKS